MTILKTKAAPADEASAAGKTRRIVVSAIVLAVIVCIFLLPYLWLISSGAKNQFDVFKDVFPLSWRAFVPVGGTLDNYAQLFVEGGVAQALLNSFLVATMQVAGSLILCTTAAYALTRIRFRGRGFIFTIVLATFMLPTEAIVVPVYRVMAGLDLQNTLVAVALPWVASAFGLFLLKPAFEELPMELNEAAKLDGAGHFRTFWSVILPNVKTSLITLSLITFLFSWNAFLWPLVVIQDTDKTLVQVAVAQSVAPGQLPNWGLTFAGAAVATVPLILLFLFLQRFFIRGLANTGLK